MAFEEQLPQWENEGTQPPQSKRVEGWLPNEKPPASWFNWLFGRAYKVMQELQEKAETKDGAQAKADAAIDTAKQYTDQQIDAVNDDLQGLTNEFAAHKADFTQLESDITNGSGDLAKYLFGDSERGTLDWQNRDLNDITKSGFYWAYSATLNRPNNINGLCIHGNVVASDNFSHQIYVTDDANIYFRSKAAGVWSGWNKLVSENVILSGTGSPEGNVAASPGSLYRRTDTGELWVKKTGTGNTGWGQVTVS